MRIKLRKNQTTIPIEQIPLEVSSLEIIGESIENIPSLKKYSKIENIQIICPASYRFPDLPTSIKVLKVKGGRPSADWLEMISTSLINLELLQLSDTKITNLCDHFFQKMSQLTVLNLKGNLLDELPISMNHLLKLSRINIDQNKLETLPHFIYKMKQITHLSMDHNLFSEEEIAKIQKNLGIWF